MIITLHCEEEKKKVCRQNLSGNVFGRGSKKHIKSKGFSIDEAKYLSV